MKGMILLPFINPKCKQWSSQIVPTKHLCRWIFTFNGRKRNQILANKFSGACARHVRIHLMTNSIVLLSIRFHISEALANILIAWILCRVWRAVCTQWYYDNELQAHSGLCQYFASSTYYLVDWIFAHISRILRTVNGNVVLLWKRAPSRLTPTQAKQCQALPSFDCQTSTAKKSVFMASVFIFFK